MLPMSEGGLGFVGVERGAYLRCMSAEGWAEKCIAERLLRIRISSIITLLRWEDGTQGT